MKDSDRLRAILAIYEVDKQICTKAAFILREDARAGTARPIEIQLIGCTAKTPKKVHPHEILDRAISVLRHIPEGTEEVIQSYAWGQIRGRPRTVFRFVSAVPEQAWIDMAPLAQQLV